MASLSKPDNRLYLGKGGSGKSTLALSHACAFDRVIICDPNGEDAHLHGAMPCSDKGELCQLVAGKEPFRICWRQSKDLRGEEWFEWANRVAWARGDTCIIWDEADLFMRHGTMPDAAYNLWNMGRHHRCRVFCCSRRPARVSADVRANLARACVFRMIETRDLEWLRAFMDDDAARTVAQLAPYHAVDWTDAGWRAKKSLFD